MQISWQPSLGNGKENQLLFGRMLPASSSGRLTASKQMETGAMPRRNPHREISGGRGLMLMLRCRHGSAATVQSPRLLVLAAPIPLRTAHLEFAPFHHSRAGDGWKVLSTPRERGGKKAFWLTVALLIPVGCGLDRGLRDELLHLSEQGGRPWDGICQAMFWGQGFRTIPSRIRFLRLRVRRHPAGLRVGRQG